MIYIPVCYFTAFFLFQLKKRKTICNIGSIITAYYVVSSAFSILYYKAVIGEMVDLHIVPTILYCLLLSLTIYPFYKIDIRNKVFRTIDNDNRTFHVISWILIILCLMFFAYILSSVMGALGGDLGRIRRSTYFEDNAVSFPWYIYPAVYAKEFSPIILLFFFYSITFMKNSRIFNALLLFSSIVLPISGIVSASRTQIIYWLMTASVLLMIFWPHMSRGSKRFTGFFVLGLSIIALLYIELVTVSRFQSLANDSIISYIGQPYVQFCNVYNHYSFDGHITFDRIFPITSKYIFGNNFNVRTYRAYHTARIGTQTGVFLTYLGDAMLDFGKIGMVIYAFVVWIIEKIFIKRINTKDLNLSSLIIMTILFRIPLLGIFAYMYLSIATSVMIIGSIVFAYFFSNIKFVINRARTLQR